MKALIQHNKFTVRCSTENSRFLHVCDGNLHHSPTTSWNASGDPSIYETTKGQYHCIMLIKSGMQRIHCTLFKWIWFTAFPVDTSHVWNSGPTPPLITFWQQLKTFLYRLSFNYHCVYLATVILTWTSNDMFITLTTWIGLQSNIRIFKYENSIWILMVLFEYLKLFKYSTIRIFKCLILETKIRFAYLFNILGRVFLS